MVEAMSSSWRQALQSWTHDTWSTSITLTIFLLFSLGLYHLALIVYRLYWSPIASFPGPKLAAVTYWYEAYYDFISEGGGQFAFQIKRLHKQYGPVVRITPDELHIDDPDYYDEVFCSSHPSRPIDKMERFRYRLNHPDSTLSTTSAEVHKSRRAALAPFFSHGRVRSYNDGLQTIMERISSRLDTEYKGTGRVIQLNHMWASLTADMIMELAFGHSSDLRNAPDFRSPVPEAMANIAYLAHYATHFPVIGMMIKFLPDALLSMLTTAARPLLEFRSDMRRHLQEMKSEAPIWTGKASRITVFHEILGSNLPPRDKSLERLTQEAILINGAGIETTTWTLTLGTAHVLLNPRINEQLGLELRSAIPDPAKILPWDKLEKLPYLNAVVMESLRLSFGSVQRLPRINRLVALNYHDQIIPPNVPVGMDAFHMHLNERIFPDPLEFKPERWLGNPKNPVNSKPLSNYLVSFSRGSRVCIGKNLAMMELHVALATLFRRHELELHETSREDVDFAVDLVKPMPKHGSKSVQITWPPANELWIAVIEAFLPALSPKHLLQAIQVRIPSSTGVMSDIGPLSVGISWFLTSLAIIFVFLRLYLRWKSSNGWASPDWIIIVALTFQIAYQAGFTAMCDAGVGKLKKDLTETQLKEISRLNWIFAPLAHPASLLARVSIAILLARIFSTRTWFRRYAIISTAFQTLLGIAVFIINVGQSYPYAALWDTSIVGAKKWDLHIYHWAAVVLQIVYAIWDLTFVLFPVMMIWKLNMQWRRKLALTILIALSLVTMAAAASKMVVSLLFTIGATGYVDTIRGTFVIDFTTCLEQALVIIMGCVPTVRLISKLEFPSVRQIGSSLVSLITRTRSKGAGSDSGSHSPRSESTENLELGTQRKLSDGISAYSVPNPSGFVVTTGGQQGAVFKAADHQVRRTNSFTVTYQA
ncbi:putative Trichodiene oxygenase [Seiridium unicorne]|uniref:Trichodiene oxygenase n=1 Tax=Seiridium unicorne TaxID=138068 RepID=A0ABR2ULI7_9PEZI